MAGPGLGRPPSGATSLRAAARSDDDVGDGLVYAVSSENAFHDVGDGVLDQDPECGHRRVDDLGDGVGEVGHPGGAGVDMQRLAELGRPRWSQLFCRAGAGARPGPAGGGAGRGHLRAALNVGCWGGNCSWRWNLCFSKGREAVGE